MSESARLERPSDTEFAVLLEGAAIMAARRQDGPLHRVVLAALDWAGEYRRRGGDTDQPWAAAMRGAAREATAFPDGEGTWRFRRDVSAREDVLEGVDAAREGNSVGAIAAFERAERRAPGFDGTWALAKLAIAAVATAPFEADWSALGSVTMGPDDSLIAEAARVWWRQTNGSPAKAGEEWKSTALASVALTAADEWTRHIARNAALDVLAERSAPATPEAPATHRLQGGSHGEWAVAGLARAAFDALKAGNPVAALAAAAVAEDVVRDPSYPFVRGDIKRAWVAASLARDMAQAALGEEGLATRNFTDAPYMLIRAAADALASGNEVAAAAAFEYAGVTAGSLARETANPKGFKAAIALSRFGLLASLTGLVDEGWERIDNELAGVTPAVDPQGHAATLAQVHDPRELGPARMACAAFIRGAVVHRVPSPAPTGAEPALA